MTYKIVGVDENSDFPPRVETKMGTKFATPSQVSAAQAAAIAASASDATTKANAAQTAAASDATTKANAATSSALQKTSNLSDLGNAGTARTNLGLGTAAVQSAASFEIAGAAAAATAAALQKTANLSDVTNVSTARTNLGLGTAATQASSAFDAAGAATTASAAAVAALGQIVSPMQVGYWHTAPVGASGTTSPAEGVERAQPIIIGRAGATIDQIGVNVTVAGSTGAVIRLGIRADGGANDVPGALILDLGTVDVTTTGAKSLTLGTPLVVSAAGTRLWFSAVVQGAATTRPTVNGALGTTPLGGMAETSLSTLLSNTQTGAQQTGTTAGALPSTQTWTHTGTAVRVGIHISA